MYSLLEGKRRQSLPKPEKNKFLYRQKQTESAKHKHGKLKVVNLTAETMQTNMCHLYLGILYDRLLEIP